MKVPMSMLALAAFTSATVLPRSKSYQVSDFPNIVAVPEGFFEEHLVPADYSLIAPVITASAPVKRATTHLYACKDINFTSTCQNFEVATGVCYSFIGSWNDSVSSLGPDAGVTCTAWFNIECTGQSLTGIVSPGITSLVSSGFNDQITSFKCV